IQECLQYLEKTERESSEIRKRFLEECGRSLVEAAHSIAETLRRGGKVLIFGNGGSAADAQHAAAEMVGRMLKERRPLAAMALTTDTSALTAIGNDYGYEKVFERQIEALAQEG